LLCQVISAYLTTILDQQQKARRLKKIMGIEGEKDDDWQAVDCHTFLVNVMSPSKCMCFVVVCCSVDCVFIMWQMPLMGAEAVSH